jgi:zinc and cadmium transporter
MEALIAALAIAALSSVGILVFRSHSIDERLYAPFLPLSVGAFLGVTFFELLPEAFHEGTKGSVAVTVGFLGFFLLSRVLREYHHHHTIGDDSAHEDAHHKERGALVLLGDGVHNFADGVVIAVAFSISVELGVATTIGIALHEIPQEIAEFYILLRAGYTKRKALVLNLLSALTVVLGALLTNFFMDSFASLVGILIGIAAGNLLYIAASDLLPSLTNPKVARRDFLTQSGLVVAGVALIATLITVSHGESHELELHGGETSEADALDVH